MTLENLDNLVKIGKLKIEPPDQKEFDGMLKSAKRRLQDTKVTGLSEDGCFLSAYGAAHALALAVSALAPASLYHLRPCRRALAWLSF